MRSCIHHAQSVSLSQLCATLWTVAHQTPQSMEFPRQACWSRLPFPTPGDLPESGIEPASLAFPALAGRFFTTTLPGTPPINIIYHINGLKDKYTHTHTHIYIYDHHNRCSKSILQNPFMIKNPQQIG